MHFGHHLAPFWLPFGSLWLTFGSLVAPLAHFWFPLATFWLTFGALWFTFGALGLTFGDPDARFSHFRCLLISFFIFSCIFVENLMQNLIFWKMLPEFRIVFLIGFLKPFQQKTRRQYQAPYLLYPSFRGLVRVYCRRQLRSTLVSTRID